MAKSARDELFHRLRVGGLRKRVARQLADGLDGVPGNGRAPKPVQDAIEQLRTLTAEVEDHAKGGPAKRRSQAARKAAATRKRNASRRSAASRRGARTRAESA
jgi:hypothetical protein